MKLRWWEWVLGIGLALFLVAYWLIFTGELGTFLDWLQGK